MNQTSVSALGLLGGALLGFLLRPSNMLIGQLPFGTVITRGANLTGLDQMLVPLARTSFNYLLVGAFIGAVGGLLLGHLLTSKRSAHADPGHVR